MASGFERAALPDFEDRSLYLEVVSYNDHPGYLERVFHHEYFHLVDYFDDGRLYSDIEWTRLNPKGTVYGRGGTAMYRDRACSSSPSSNSLNACASTGWASPSIKVSG